MRTRAYSDARPLPFLLALRGSSPEESAEQSTSNALVERRTHRPRFTLLFSLPRGGGAEPFGAAGRSPGYLRQPVTEHAETVAGLRLHHTRTSLYVVRA
jgi:hypothetical protein